jgi:hypothetical protein
MDELEAEVRRTGRKVARHDAERDAHIAAIVAALNAGCRPTDVVSWSPWTAANVRKQARLRGVPAGKRGGE